MFTLERWKVGGLLGAWCAYWAALVGVTIGPGLLTAWRLTHGRGSHGRITASVDSGRLLLDVNQAVAAGGRWTFSTSLTTALLWTAVPPLALWVLWLVSRPRRSLPPQTDDLLPAPGAAPMTPGRTPAERVDR